MTKLSLIETESNVSTKVVPRLETVSKNIYVLFVCLHILGCTWLCGFALVDRNVFLYFISNSFLVYFSEHCALKNRLLK